jgi:hypothetical protein
LDASHPSLISDFLITSAFLKRGYLDKFESHSSDGLLLGYTTHVRSYRVINLDTNTVIDSCDVTFDESAPFPRDIF